MGDQDVKVSVAIIARNEEACIGRCLKSVSAFSERVVVDTGSDDATKRIAQHLGATVYDFEWCDNFAEARNFAKNKCTGEWILSIDADEILEDEGPDKIRRVIQTWDERKGWPTVHVCVHSPLGTTKYFVPRLFENLDWIHWKGAAHNYLNVRTGPRSDINILGGFSPSHHTDEERTIRILEKELNRDPSLVREKYYLGREYCFKQRWDDALEMLVSHSTECTFKPELSESLLLQAKIWRIKNCNFQALKKAAEAVKVNENFKEAWDFILMYRPYDSEVRTRFAMADDRDTLFIRLGRWHTDGSI